MKYKSVSFDQENEYSNDFLDLPTKLYSKKDLTQNRTEEEALLRGSHPLSGYFKLTKFLVYDGNQAVARGVVTVYKDSTICYVGFFECVNSPEAAMTLFQAIHKYAKQNSFSAIEGPVDASFWIKYRLKTDGFSNRPYYGEPYNKDYYLEFFEQNGYKISKKYSSNHYGRSVSLSDVKKFNRRHKEFSRKKYIIVSPKKDQVLKTQNQLHELISELYGDFPIYRKISQHDFRSHFSQLWGVLDFSVIKIAYYKNKPAGFIVGFPDYGNLLFRKASVYVKLRIFLERFRSRRYVIMYMGVRKSHQGLGKAMVRSLVAGNLWKNSTYIGALIAEGKVTESYTKDNIISKSNYVLLRKELK